MKTKDSDGQTDHAEEPLSAALKVTFMLIARNHPWLNVFPAMQGIAKELAQIRLPSFKAVLCMITGILLIVIFIKPDPFVRAVRALSVKSSQAVQDVTTQDFYLTRYVTAKTDRGVVGFEAGSRVRLVRPIPGRQTVLVTDGEYQVEMNPSLLSVDPKACSQASTEDSASR